MKDINEIRSTPFMDRTGSEQERLRSYWFSHTTEIPENLMDYLGMSTKEYYAWLEGSLKLKDGSYHEMEPSYFQLSTEAVSVVRKILDPENPETYYRLRAQFLDELPPGKECTFLLKGSKDNRYFVVIDPGDDLIAVVTNNEVLHKEDFAKMMKDANLEATEKNFNAVCAAVPEEIPSGISMSDVIRTAIETIKEELNMIKKPSLNTLLQSAEERAAKQPPDEPFLFLFNEDWSGDRMGKPGDFKNAYNAQWHEFYSLGADGKPQHEVTSLNFYDGLRLVPGGNDIGEVDAIEAFRKNHPDHKVIVLNIEWSKKDIAERISDAVRDYEMNHKAAFVLPAYNKQNHQPSISR